MDIQHMGQSTLFAVNPEQAETMPPLESEDDLENIRPISERERAYELFLYDVDGVLTSPTEKRVVHLEIIDAIADQLRAGAQVALNTGRSTRWVEEQVVPHLSSLVGDDPDCLARLSIIGEKGNLWTRYNQSGEAIHGKSRKATVPSELKDAIFELASKYTDIMDNLDPKETMISLEMLDGLDVSDFQAKREPFIEAAKKIIKSNPDWAGFCVDATTIAVDIESIHASKALGANRFLQILCKNGVNYLNAEFTTFGDSPSDIEMAQSLARNGLPGKHVHVGDNPESLPPSDHFETIHYEGFDTGTSNYLQRAVKL